MIDLLAITLKDLLNPEFYINNGGLWVLLFIVFAETGLFVGFFLPGDSLLVTAGLFAAAGQLSISVLLMELITAAILTSSRR